MRPGIALELDDKPHEARGLDTCGAAMGPTARLRTPGPMAMYRHYVLRWPALPTSWPPGSPEARARLRRVAGARRSEVVPLARSGAPIAEATHRRKLGDLPGAIACGQRALALISATGVRNGIWIVQSWLIGFNLVAGRTREVIADGLPLLKQLQGTRNEMALSNCRRAVVTALLANDDLARARPLARVGVGVRMPRVFRCKPTRPGRICWPCWPRSKAGRAPRCQALGLERCGVGRAPAGETRPRQLGGHPACRIGRQRRTRGRNASAELRREGALLRWQDVDKQIAFAGEDIS